MCNKCKFLLRFSIQKSGGDRFSLLTVLIDDEPYWTTGELEISSSPSQCVGLELSLSVGQTVKVLNRLYSYVFINDNGLYPSWFGGFAAIFHTDIGGSKRAPAVGPPVQPKIFSISCSFSKLAPPWEGWRPSYRKPGSAPDR